MFYSEFIYCQMIDYADVVANGELIHSQDRGKTEGKFVIIY